MEGPFDPHSPDQDPGASEPEAQDGDLHALLERLLGQGDVRPAEAGAGDDLWPDLLAPAAPEADEVSTIVPAPDASFAVAELPPSTDPLDEAVTVPAEDLAPARAWEPVLDADPPVDVDAPLTPSELDDIHAAILASVSVDIEPLAPVAPEAAPFDTTDHVDTLSLAGTEHVEPAEPFASSPVEDAAPVELAPVDLAPVDVAPIETASGEPAFLEPAFAEPASVEPAWVDPAPAAGPEDEFLAVLDQLLPAQAEAAAEPDPVPFSLTPFEAPAHDAAADMNLDAEALWAAALPELGIDVAPQLDLDGDAEDEPSAPTAVVLPWPSHEPKVVEPPAVPGLEPKDLIEAALAGLSADLTSEPVEPLRTPDVAAATAHVVFRLGARAMAIPLAAVSEIARPPRTTRLPHVPAWVIGIANLRGDIVSILDLEGFLSGKAGRSTHEQRMLALRPSGDDVRTAVLVDRVDGIQAFEDGRVARVTRGFDAEVAPYARGLYQLEDELVVVLDADRLLQSKPMRQFEDGAGAR